MKHPHLLASAAVLALSAAHPALAEISAPQIWEDWQALVGTMTDDGSMMNAESESFDDGVLTLDNVTFHMPIEGGTVSVNLPQIVMSEMDDGSVDIAYLGDYSVSLDTTTPEDGAIQAQFTLTMPGMEINATEVDGGVAYTFAAPQILGELTALTVDSAEVDAQADMTMAGVSGTYTLFDGEPMRFDSSYAAQTLAVQIAFADPETPQNSLNVTADYAGIQSSSAGTVLGAAAMNDPAAMLSGEVEATGSYSHRGGGYTVQASSVEDGPFNLAVDSASGGMDYGLSADGLTFAMNNTDVALTVSGAGIPLPEVAATLDRLEFGLTTPLQQADEAQDVALLANLGGLGVSEMMWSMIDPAGALPHDPATLMVALEGKMRLTADLTDEAAMNAPVPPFDFDELTLTGLQLALGGAELTGTGGFDFSQAPEGALPGMPGVAGDVTLELAGGNGLLQKLVGMGLIPQDQAMMFQAMIGMLATPVGDDLLESKIEFGADGSITANGTPLR